MSRSRQWKPQRAKALVRDSVCKFAYHTGLGRVASGAFPNTLRVLLYHRICNPDGAQFFGLKSNVSARPDGFAAQLDYMARNYEVVSLGDCLDWLDGKLKLPKRAVLITFDDGYRDNLTEALPELSARAMPCTIFLATDALNDRRVFYWDWVAEAFRRSHHRSAKLPVLGARDWGEDTDAISELMVQRLALMRPEIREKHLDDLSGTLAYPRQAPPQGTYLSEADICAMQKHGVTFGAHTMSHPMCSLLSERETVAEIRGSRQEIELILGQPPVSFAFPHGGLSQIPSDPDRVLKESGIKVAFRSTGSINFRPDVSHGVPVLRRRSVSLGDDMASFAASAAGFVRLIER